MFLALGIGGLSAAAAAVWWRLPGLIARSIRPIHAESLGFHASGDDARLAEHVGDAFRFGIRARMIRPRSDWVAQCDSLEPHWRPFAFEGAAFGQAALASVSRARWADLERIAIAPRPEYVYLAHVGAGFWGAFRYGRRFDRLRSHLEFYDPLYRYLAADGYGFKFGFFDFMRDRRSVAHFAGIDAYWRSAAYQGLGRALYFAYLSDRPGLFETVGSFAPDHDCDMIAGAGLAAAFAEFSRPKRAIDFARAVPYEWRPHVHLGMTFGLKARALCDASYFESCLAKLPPASAAAMRRAIAFCDEVEHDVRRDGGADGYRRWREGLTERLEREAVWEPVYQAVEEGLGDRRGVVGHRSGEES